SIKAVGIVKKNLEDGHTVKVNWINDYQRTTKEWYFYTSRVAIWMLDYNSDSRNSHLIEFSLNDVKQDYNIFLSRDYCKKQFYNEEQFQEYVSSRQETKIKKQNDWVDRKSTRLNSSHVSI